MVTSNLTPPNQAAQAEHQPLKLWTEYYALVIVLELAVFVAAAYFLFQPRILGIKETNAQTESSLASTVLQRRYLTSLEQSVAAAQSIPADALDRVSESLPYSVDQPTLLMQFSAAAAKNGIQISSIGFSAPRSTAASTPSAGGLAPAGSVGTVAIQLSVNAQSYLAIKQFMADLETSLQLMDITSISAASGGEEGKAAYQLQLQTYIYSSSTLLTR